MNGTWAGTATGTWDAVIDTFLGEQHLSGEFSEPVNGIWNGNWEVAINDTGELGGTFNGVFSGIADVTVDTPIGNIDVDLPVNGVHEGGILLGNSGSIEFQGVWYELLETHGTSGTVTPDSINSGYGGQLDLLLTITESGLFTLYIEVGAEIVETATEVFNRSDMVMHVKEPQPSEYSHIRKDQIVFTYLHLAANKDLTTALIDTNSINIAYETIENANGSLPLLAPMSEVAGRLASQEAAKYLEKTFGGRGILMGGVPGTPPAKIIIIGGGTVGIQAAHVACGMGAHVYILDMNLERLRYLSEVMPKNCTPLMSSPATIRELIKEADAVIGGVLVTGAKAPKLVTKEMLKTMKKGAVLVDVAIDQGGCFETSKATTHGNPIFVVDDIIHYCVANMPGAVPMTSTLALTNATLPYALEIANKGWKQAALDSNEIKTGINIINGKITYKAVADAFNLKYTPVDDIL
ncbi:MAG: alanine dehydrogenase [Desulfobacteraceae bacterium 4572_19]|nr:MAG: alanine dehydrogenase [Desulfobacteraceae bacterium 4572_19]